MSDKASLQMSGGLLLILGALWYLLRKPNAASPLSGFGENHVKYFSADWCPACEDYTPKIIEWWSNNSVKIDRLKIKDWNDPIAKKYKIKSLPYVMLNGKPIDPQELLKLKF